MPRLAKDCFNHTAIKIMGVYVVAWVSTKKIFCKCLESVVHDPMQIPCLKCKVILYIHVYTTVHVIIVVYPLGLYNTCTCTHACTCFVLYLYFKVGVARMCPYFRGILPHKGFYQYATCTCTRTACMCIPAMK